MTARFFSYLRQHHIGLLALFIALGGTAYAATLPRNSVGTAQLKTNAVTTAKIKRNAVTGAKLKANGVTGDKVKAGSLTGQDIDEATLPTVPLAAAADRATTAGTADLANSVAEFKLAQRTVSNPDGLMSTLIWNCGPALSASPWRAVSAGVRFSNPNSQYLVDLFPVNAQAWEAHVDNTGSGGDATLSLICIRANSFTFP